MNLLSRRQPLDAGDHGRARVMFHNVAGMVAERPGTPWPALDPLARRLPLPAAPFRSAHTLPGFFARQRPDVLCLAEVPMNEHGHSPVVEVIAALCGLAHRRVDLLHPSHVSSEGGYLGLAVLSRFAITSAELVTFSDLGLDAPGRVPHTKGIQCMRLALDDGAAGGGLRVFNLHLPAVHIFDRRMNDPAFASLHRELEHAIYLRARGVGRAALQRTVITGDFNNRDIALADAFPELRLGRVLREAVIARSTVLGVPGAQSDHLLTSVDLGVARAGVHWTTSDHAALQADLIVPAS